MRPSRRRPRGRQRHADEIRAAESAAPHRRPPLIDRVLRTAGALSPATTTLVVGHGADAGPRRSRIAPDRRSSSCRSRSWAPATRCCRPRRCCAGSGHVLLLSGDVPLLTSRRSGASSRRTARPSAAATVLTAQSSSARTATDASCAAHGRITRIVEERDASPAQREIKRDQLRHLCVRARAALRRARRDRVRQRPRRVLPARPHRHLPAPAARRSRRDDSTTPSEIRGINSRTELAEVSTMVRQQKNEELMAAASR